MNFLRQAAFLDPNRFRERKVHVLGVGALGSWVAYQLAKLGIRNIHLYDHDTIEDHNVPNQIYGRGEIGKKKVEALKELIERTMGDWCNVVTHDVDLLKEEVELDDIVVCAVDSLDLRRKLWEENKDKVRLWVDGRMSISYGVVYGVDTTRNSIIENYSISFDSDENAEESPCNERAIVNNTVLIANAMVNCVVAYLKGKTVPHYIVASSFPLNLQVFKEEESNEQS